MRAVVGRFFADDEQEPNVYVPRAEAFGGADHRRRDSLGVTRPASAQHVAVDARWNERRNGVEMRRERYAGERISGACRREDVITPLRHGDSPYGPLAPAKEPMHPVDYRALASAGGVDFHEPGGEIDGIDDLEIRHISQ